MKEITPLILKAWMKSKKITQTALAEMLGTSQGTVNRWINGVHEISGPERKLLAYLMFGELPFNVQTPDQGWHLDFTEAEFAVIQLLARREGFISAEAWIAEKIRAYLRMGNAAPPNSSLAAEEQTPYKVKRK